MGFSLPHLPSDSSMSIELLCMHYHLSNLICLLDDIMKFKVVFQYKVLVLSSFFSQKMKPQFLSNKPHEGPSMLPEFMWIMSQFITKTRERQNKNCSLL